jgi:hypothetical protein
LIEEISIPSDDIPISLSGVINTGKHVSHFEAWMGLKHIIRRVSGAKIAQNGLNGDARATDHGTGRPLQMSGLSSIREIMVRD